MTAARIYGRTVGHGSHARVTAGFAYTLRAAALLAGVVALDDEALDEEQPGGAQADHGVFTGPLELIDRMVRNTRHARRWAMVAPNSDRIPHRLADHLNRVCTDVLAPSGWSAEVLRAYVTQPIHIVPHGVGAFFQAQPDLREVVRQRYAKGMFRVLHLSTSDRDRKGTEPLLQAWEVLKATNRLPANAMLELVLDPFAYERIVVWMAKREKKPAGVLLHARANLNEFEMSKGYAHAHVVCQPSRGEGFGMCGLEALACGVPIVATACTGHSEWLHQGVPGAVIVAHGGLAPTDDLPDALSPAVDADEIAAALKTAYEHWNQLEMAAMDAAARVRAEWAWTEKLKPWLAALRA